VLAKSTKTEKCRQGDSQNKTCNKLPDILPLSPTLSSLGNDDDDDDNDNDYSDNNRLVLIKIITNMCLF
jgi:hypothetical protein